MRKSIKYKIKSLIAALLIAVGIFTISGCGEDAAEYPGTTSPGGATGVTYSPFLDSPSIGEMVDYDGLQLILYSLGSKYIIIEFNNVSTEARTIGGPYSIQRNIDGEYHTVGPNPSEVYINYTAGTENIPASKMRHTNMYYYDRQNYTSTEINLSSDDDIIEIRPGECIHVSLMIIDLDIPLTLQSEGTYRLIYGDYEIEFEIKIDYAC